MEGKGSVERRFVVDSMLGKVAKWLRILGYDTRFEPLDESKLIEYSGAGWLLLTRRRSWCGRKGVVCLTPNAPIERAGSGIHLRDRHRIQPMSEMPKGLLGGLASVANAGAAQTFAG